MKTRCIEWIARIAVIVIIGQTLFFKFTDHPETVALFERLGQGALAYKTIGSLELLACVLLLIRPVVIWGALLSLGLMSGAIFAHIGVIGFSGPDGTLGLLAIVAAVLSVLILVLRRLEIPLIGSHFRNHHSPQ